MDQILLQNVRLDARHGVHDFEKQNEQPFAFDIALSLDLTEAGKTDDLEKTVSYSDVYRILEDVVLGKSCNLIEHLAQRLCDSILDFSAQIEQVDVTVKKLQPPVEGRFDYMAVRISRRR